MVAWKYDVELGIIVRGSVYYRFLKSLSASLFFILLV